MDHTSVDFHKTLHNFPCGSWKNVFMLSPALMIAWHWLMKSCAIALIALIWLAGPAADARQELRTAIKSEPSTLDPGAGVTIADEQIAGDLLEGLTVKGPTRLRVSFVPGGLARIS
jgi:hypothetical protein